MVTTLAPSTADTCIWQERTADPLMWTVQAPQKPAPQPYFVPVNPTWSRITHSRGVLGSVSTDTGLSFNVNEAMRSLPELALYSPLRDRGDRAATRRRKSGRAVPGQHNRTRFWF